MFDKETVAKAARETIHEMLRASYPGLTVLVRNSTRVSALNRLGTSHKKIKRKKNLLGTKFGTSQFGRFPILAI